MKAKTKPTKKLRRLPFLLALLVICSGVISLFSGNSISATDFRTLDTVTPEQQADSASYYTILSDCFDEGIKINGRIDISDAKTTNPSPSLWFTRSVTVYFDGEETTCSEVVDSALTLWGWTKDNSTALDYSGFLIAAGCGYNEKGQYYGCNANGDNRAENVQKAIRLRVYGGEDESNVTKLNEDISTIAVSPAADYVRSYKTFFNACSPTAIDVDSILAADPDSTIKSWLENNYYEEDSKNNTVTVYTYLNTVNIPYTVDASGNKSRAGIGTTVSNAFKYTTPWASNTRIGGIQQKSFFVYGASGGLYSARQSTCADLAATINSSATNDAGTGYLNYYNLHIDTMPMTDFIKIQEEAEQKKDGTTKTTCGINGVGWLVCPVLTFLGEISEKAFNFLASSFLKTNVSYFNTDSSNGDTSVYQAWTAARNFANIAFVIVFLVVIFSQMTSFGIDNYGIKKILPRMVIAVILVNASFYICQIAIDISNIAGYSIKGIFDGLGTYIKIPSNITDASSNGLGIAAIIVSLLAAGIGVALVISIPVLLSILLALLMIVLILVGRTALIIILTIISPLAFVAYLLPNTEQWFKKWGKLLFNMLILFPTIALLFGAGNLTARIIHAATPNDTTMQLVAVATAVLPLFAVPSLLKGALNATGSIGKKLSGWSSKANNLVAKKGREKYATSDFARTRELNKKAKAEYKARRYAERVQGGGWRASGSRVASIGFGRKSQYARERLANSSLAAVEKAEEDDVKQARMNIGRELRDERLKDPVGFNSDELLQKWAREGSRTELQRTAAIHELAAMGRDRQIRELMDKTDPANIHVDPVSVRKAISANAGALVAKAPDLVKTKDAAFSTVTGQDLAGFSKSTGGEYMKYLQELKSTNPTAYGSAKNAFNSAIESVAKDPALAAKFDNDTGLRIFSTVNSFSLSDPAFYADITASTNWSKIDSTDGKIR